MSRRTRSRTLTKKKAVENQRQVEKSERLVQLYSAHDLTFLPRRRSEWCRSRR
jgi:hypothetical protein